MVANPPTRVALIDDHEIVRIGIRELIDTADDLHVVAEAGNGAAAVAVLATTEVDVAVVDVRIGEEYGIDICRRLHADHPDLALIVLTSFDDDQAMVEAADAGVAAFLLKQVRGNEIVETIRAVAGGARPLDSATVRLAQRRIDDEEGGLLVHLSERERMVFDLIGDGLSNRQIADELYVAEKTVKNYVTSLLAKLQLERRTEVAAMAARIAERQRRRFE